MLSRVKRTILTTILLLIVTVTINGQGVNTSEGNASASLLALKTNLLYDAALIPNIGLEVSLGKQWTVAADWFYTWFSSDSRHRYWQSYGGYLTVRRYFGNGPQPSNPDYSGSADFPGWQV